MHPAHVGVHPHVNPHAAPCSATINVSKNMKCNTVHFVTLHASVATDARNYKWYARSLS